MRALLLLLISVLPSQAQGLRYRMKLWFRGAEAPVEGRFTVDTTAPTRSSNRIQKPRLGGWVIRPVAGSDRATQALILARAPGLLFLSTPVPQAVRTSVHTTVGGRSYAFWGLRTPPGLVASVALAELAPRTLAVMELTSEPRSGDLARVELHLESAERLSSAAPPQDGTALLGTLEAWAKLDHASADAGAVTVLR
ncbi:MAG TPA: hypothetical protein VNV60_01180 [Holophagaceae bacterium]|jgi:hypothetical protein|nr:hypothetical protein [Holophagaceae bacterium]